MILLDRKMESMLSMSSFLSLEGLGKKFFQVPFFETATLSFLSDMHNDSKYQPVENDAKLRERIVLK